MRKIDSPPDAPNIDYEDVKAKIVENEGYDMHDFGIFDDRSATLWRKPYIDGAVRELTAGNDKSVEQLRQTVEDMILARQDYSVRVKAVSQSSSRASNNATVTVTHEAEEWFLDYVRRLGCYKCYRSRCVSVRAPGRQRGCDITSNTREAGTQWCHRLPPSHTTPPRRSWRHPAGSNIAGVIRAVVLW